MHHTNDIQGPEMFPKRFKIGSARNNEWRCCLCLHVRTATILLGIWRLVLHILALVVLALLMRNNNALIQHNEDFENNFLPTPLSKKDDNPYYLPTTQDGNTISPSDIDMSALMTVCTLSITLLMVYGAIRGKATHLLPFFCLQLFDFAITTLTATGYFCYLRSVHRLVAEHWYNLPFRNELLKLSPQYLSLLVLAAFLVSMLWKAYCIGVVWRCYKYLTLRQQTRNSTIHYILPGEGGDRIPEPDYSTLLREQEASLGILKQTPPPSYQDIMNEQPPPYPAILLNECVNAPQFSMPISVPTAIISVAENVEQSAVENNETGSKQERQEERQAVVVVDNIDDNSSPSTSAGNVNNEIKDRETEEVGTAAKAD